MSVCFLAIANIVHILNKCQSMNKSLDYACLLFIVQLSVSHIQALVVGAAVRAVSPVGNMWMTGVLPLDKNLKSPRKKAETKLKFLGGITCQKSLH